MLLKEGILAKNRYEQIDLAQCEEKFLQLKDEVEAQRLVPLVCIKLSQNHGRTTTRDSRDCK